MNRLNTTRSLRQPRIWLATALALVLGTPLSSSAQGWTFPEKRSGWERFALGFAAGVAIHEFGHYAVAKSKGYSVTYDGLTIVYPGAVFSDADRLQVSSAGFQAQWLMTELVLRDSRGRESKNPPGDFGAGMVNAHLGITLAYLTFLKNHKQGDVAGMAQATGWSRSRMAWAVAIPAALDAWRLYGNDVPDWVPNLSLVGKGLGLVWIWSY